jgi:hypothetical protein
MRLGICPPTPGVVLKRRCAGILRAFSSRASAIGFLFLLGAVVARRTQRLKLAIPKRCLVAFMALNVISDRG